MPTNRRCKEKFHAAIYRLAVGESDVRSRLRGAYRYLHMLREHEVPEMLRTEWSAILTSLTRYGPEVDIDGTRHKDAVTHTMARIRNSIGRVIAERIYTLVASID